MELITYYFPELTDIQRVQFTRLLPLYTEWNEKINLISRKDLDNFYERHVLHSLSIVKANPFNPGENVLDIGTGGGFPGIPLAIYFPETQFTLIDSIGKKINVVDEVVKALGLKNVKTQIIRAEHLKQNYDYIVTRAVAKTSDLLHWSRNKNAKKIIAIKGGDLKEELAGIQKNIRILELKDMFEEPFFETKKIVVCS